jgi:regulatory protein
MKKITTLRAGKGREKRLNVFLDGRFGFSLGVETALKENLKVGEELSDSQVAGLLTAEGIRRCREAALLYLNYRPRSESEVKTRLRRRGFDAEQVGAVIARLKEQGLLDDEAFARFWTENRESFNPRSRRLTRQELLGKGVDGEVIDRVVSDLDDAESAYRSALSKARRWPRSDRDLFHRRLGEYLRRRGFGYEVIKSTVERIWQEPGNGAG